LSTGGAKRGRRECFMAHIQSGVTCDGSLGQSPEHENRAGKREKKLFVKGQYFGWRVLSQEIFGAEDKSLWG